MAEADGLRDGLDADDERKFRRPLDYDDPLAVVEEHRAVAEVRTAVEIDGDVGARVRLEPQASLRRRRRVDRQALDTSSGKPRLARVAEDLAHVQHHLRRRGAGWPSSATRAALHARSTAPAASPGALAST